MCGYEYEGFLLTRLKGFSDGSKKLMSGEWRDWTYAEYAKVPLENCIPLDEERLLGSVENGGLGYSTDNLAQIHRLLVAYGGLNDIGLQAGQTVVIAPATGMFGGRAVEVALAMGAQVSRHEMHPADITGEQTNKNRLLLRVAI